MASTALARAHAMQARHRMTVKGFEREVVRKGSVSLTAGALGTMSRMGVKDDLHGFPWKMGLWLGATLVEVLSRNKMVSVFAAGVSDATLAIYIDRAVATKSLVAGENEI